MREDNFPRPVSDPEAEGLPGVADDDSSARDEVETGRIADGPEPAPLPLDRDEGPLAIDRYGTTPEEQRVGEPLDMKLGRELPDPALSPTGERHDVTPSPSPVESFDADALDTAVDAVDEDTALELDTAPVQPNLGSPVSMYDTGLGIRDETVGRLVEPDEGIGEDTEKDAIAHDAGAAGGGPSAEESALHPITER
jgi:hypothetical protein